MRQKKIKKETMENKTLKQENTNLRANLEAIMQYSDDYILICDDKGKPVAFNEAYKNIMLRILGIKMRPGLQPHKLLPAADQVAWWDNIHKRVLSGESFRIDYSMPGDKEILHWEFSYNPIFTSGKVTGFIEVSRDITARIKAQEQLKIKDQAIESSQNAIFFFNFDNKITYANQSFLKLWKYDKAEAVGKSITELGFDQSTLEKLKGKLASNGFWTGETLVKKDTDSVFHIQLTVNYVKDKTAKPLFTMGSLVDITEKKLHEVQINQWKNRYNSAIMASRHILYDWNPASNNVTYGGDLEKILGYSLEEMTGGLNHWFSLIHPEDRDRIAEIIQLSLTDKAPVLLEYRVLKKDGTYIFIEDSGRYITDSEGQIERMVGFVKDITDLKAAEKDKERLMEQLTHKNEELQGLLYVASHDLRSPLVNIQGFSTELFRSITRIRGIVNRECSEKTKEKINTIFARDSDLSIKYINESSLKMDRLLAGLQKINRIGSNQPAVILLDMQKLVKDVLKSMDYQIKSSKAKIHCSALASCYADWSQINQVFTNLIDNALKYRKTEVPLKIEISCRLQKEDAIYCVQDNGIGIADHQLNNIFKIFHRVETHSSISGEGLGLALVHRIILSNRGKVWVESELGKGSRFYIMLPTRQEEFRVIHSDESSGLNLPYGF